MQTHKCYIAAYEIEAKIVPIVAHTLFFVNAFSRDQWYPSLGLHQKYLPQGGYRIEASDDGFSDLERRWFFGVQMPRFRSKHELMEALDDRFSQPMDDYAQFSAAVEAFSSNNNVKATPLKRVVERHTFSGQEFYTPLDKRIERYFLKPLVCLV